jgi:hypothetical protein
VNDPDTEFFNLWFQIKVLHKWKNQKKPKHLKNSYILASVADPDPHVFGPPVSGSGSISQRYPEQDPDPDPSIIKQIK